jgi:hypothetical protein
MGRKPNRSIRLCWSARMAVVMAGGLLLPLADFLVLRLLPLLAGMLGVLIAVSTYRFSRGYRTNTRAVAVIIGSCLLSSLLAGLSHYVACGVVNASSRAQVLLCGAHSIETTVLSSAFFTTFAGLIVALTVGKYIVPACQGLEGE